MSQESSYLELTRMQRIYVDSRLAGMSQVASAAAAGSDHPKKDGNRFEKNEKVQAAMVARMQKVADEVDFGRKEAHDMLMEAFRNAETASEQVMAVNAMIKLHGLEKPKQVEVQHKHEVSGDLRFMPTDELMKLAGMEGELVLDGEFEEVGEKPSLEPPPVTDDNLEEPEALPDSSKDY